MTPTTTSARPPHTTAALLALGACALAACGGTTQSAAATVPLSTIAVGTTIPTAVPETVPPTAPITTIAPTVPTTTTPPTTTPPPTTPPTTTPPPTTTQPPPTTAPPPISVVEELDFFKARHEESGGGINSQNFWFLDPDSQLAQVNTGHGPFAVAEAAEVRAMLYSSFQPRSSDATVTWDVSWSGYMTSFVGADSSARARVTLRVYEIFAGSGPATVGPTVFERTVADDGVGSALQGVATLRMNGADSQTVALPPLDPGKFYRLEAELECSSRVAISAGATVCTFGEEAAQGLRVNDWSIRFDNVPAA